MCLLSYYPPNVQPKQKILEGGAYFNDDGHGYAIIVGDTFHIQKDLDADGAVRDFVADRARYPEGPALFHSRIGTSGARSVINCHPFYVDHFGGRTILAHNGVLPAPTHPDKDDWRSDTRILAEDFIGSRFHLRTSRQRRRLARWIGTGNKLVVLTTDPTASQSAYIINQSQGHWLNGVWYSNHSYSYLWADSPWWTKSTYAKDREIILGNASDTCAHCRALHTVSAVSGMCDACFTCNDCGEFIEKCQCWHPGRHHYSENVILPDSVIRNGEGRCIHCDHVDCRCVLVSDSTSVRGYRRITVNVASDGEYASDSDTLTDTERKAIQLVLQEGERA